jgi:GTP-binding protein EngB required for normal cell division
MRRGLGTPNEAEAEAMVGEMNTILSDQTWWNAAKRQEAVLRFSKPVIEAFYDEIQAGRQDSESLRESHIRLPDKDDGYSRVLFVGTTGAGKTSLLRQLIGSDPDDDRFPSTAPAKTTIADIEVIQDEGDFEAAVTFFTEFQTQANIEECVVDAALAVLENAPRDRVADRFLSHRDQKFRLSYILGGWLEEDGGSEQGEISFEELPDSPAVTDDEGGLGEPERAANREAIAAYLDRIGHLTKSVTAALAEDLGVDHNTAGPDRDAALQLIEETFDLYLTQDEGFHELVQDILEDVRSRFDRIEAGQLQCRQSGWPELWLFSSADRDDFIRHIRWFSSNYWPQFGRLLTPLVDGIRVRGPLVADFIDGQPKLALIDGQGLGHTPDSSSSVTTHVTRRFAHVDVILLVDNAQQPMQAAPLSVLRAVASSGHHRKLAVAFTHFDQIKGQNFQKFADKRAHVMASVLNALSSLRDALGVVVVNAIEHGIDSRCFMLGSVDRQLAKLPTRTADYMRGQLFELVGFFQKAILPPPPAEASPSYDPTGIGFAVQDAVSKFQGPWLARLGMGTYEGFRKEHWTRVKALNRRIAGELDDEYDTLQPIADLATQLRESISRFLNSPIGWKCEPASAEEAQVAVDRIRQVIEVQLHDLAVRRLVQEHLTDWRAAYDGPASHGLGSSFRRANIIQSIYDAAAPIPDAVMTTPSVAFLAEIRRIVTSAIKTGGGEVRLSEAA